MSMHPRHRAAIEQTLIQLQTARSFVAAHGNKPDVAQVKEHKVDMVAKHG